MKATKPRDVDAYIKGFPDQVQGILQQIRETIKKSAPESEEVISYGMPGYRLFGQQLVFFAGFKNHIGFYALPSGNEAFQKELSRFKTGKGSIQFPLDEPIPFKLIRKIVEFRIAENLEKGKVDPKK